MEGNDNKILQETTTIYIYHNQTLNKCFTEAKNVKSFTEYISKQYDWIQDLNGIEIPIYLRLLSYVVKIND